VHRFGVRGVCVTVIALTLAILPSPAGGVTPADRIWFCPGPGTLDYTRLFAHPEEWTRARQLFSVFKFYQQHTELPAPEIVGPNSLDALVRADAFRTLNRWGKKIAIEVGSVKEHFCGPNGGMPAAIASSVSSIRAIQNGGGTVAYLAMDEPFVSGRSRICGGPALEPTADQVATYVTGVRAVFPNVQIGLIEAYPFSSADQIETIIQLLKARNVMPAFLHMDIDWHLSGAAAFERDMARLKTFATASNLPFGIIITGYNGDADALYAVDVYGITDLVASTFGNDWSRMPDQLIFQSWVASATGLRITPTNIPERTLFTHSEMLTDVYHRLRGAAGSGTGKAVGR
jgi:hypothetical protein